MKKNCSSYTKFCQQKKIQFKNEPKTKSTSLRQVGRNSKQKKKINNERGVPDNKNNYNKIFLYDLYPTLKEFIKQIVQENGFDNKIVIITSQNNG